MSGWAWLGLAVGVSVVGLVLSPLVRRRRRLSRARRVDS